jgi:MFS family permease
LPHDKVRNGFRNAYAIQGINAFIFGVTFIVVPLLMVERGIDVQEMGLIFAALPLVSQFARLLFGCVSDYAGRKLVFAVNALANTAFLAAYYMATGAVGFLTGKLFEGVKDMAIWSVNRPYFMDHVDDERDRERTLIKFRGFNSVFEALGMMASGFLVAALAFDGTMLLLIAVSLLALPNVAMLVDRAKQKMDFGALRRSLDLRRKGRRFMNFLGIFLLLGLSWGFLSGYIMPLFLATMGVPVQYIGLLLGVRVLFNGVSIWVFSSMWSGKRKILVGGLLFSIAIASLGFVGYAALPLAVVLVGMIAGIADAGYETVFILVCDRKSLGRDMSMLMIGVNVGMAITQALSGFVIASLGFPTMFFAAAMLFALFSVASYHNMNGKD